MNAMKRGLAVVLLGAGVSSCLLQEVTHTLLLEADGSVTWTVYQKDIRSDGKTQVDRDREEGEFWDQARLDEHPVAAGLREIGGMDLQTTFLRDRRPYSLRTTARFDSLARVFESLLVSLDVPGKVEVVEDGDGTTLLVRVDLSNPDKAHPSEAVTALIADGNAWRIVLAEGRFVKATGFTLEDANTAATLDDVKDETLEQNDGQLTLSLTWSKEG